MRAQNASEELEQRQFETKDFIELCNQCPSTIELFEAQVNDYLFIVHKTPASVVSLAVSVLWVLRRIPDTNSLNR